MSENKSKFNIKYINTNIGQVYYRFAEFFIIIHIKLNFRTIANVHNFLYKGNILEDFNKEKLCFSPAKK